MKLNLNFLCFPTVNFVLYILIFSQISVLKFETYPTAMIMKILPRIDPSRPYLKEASKFIRKEKVGPEKVPIMMPRALLKYFYTTISDNVARCKTRNYANGFLVHKQESGKRKRSLVNHSVATRFTGGLSTPSEKIRTTLHIEVRFIYNIFYSGLNYTLIIYQFS